MSIYPAEGDLIEGGSLKLKLHYEVEGETLKQILQLEQEFRAHFDLVINELLLQKEVTDRLWVLSQRYIILVSTGPCCKYPDIYASPAEDVIISEYHEKLKLLDVSNSRMMDSIHGLRTSCNVFNNLCSQLDMSVESPFILGDPFHKPLPFYIELISDVFKCFHSMILKLKYSLHQTDPYDCTKLEEYKSLLKVSEDFEEYFKESMIYCKCLIPKKDCGRKSIILEKECKNKCKE